jgi:hypothetical protein
MTMGKTDMGHSAHSSAPNAYEMEIFFSFLVHGLRLIPFNPTILIGADITLSSVEGKQKFIKSTGFCMENAGISVTPLKAN